MFDSGTVICRESPGGKGWSLFQNPRRVLQASDLHSVHSCFEQVREALRHGLWVAGWIAYEAAPAFDPTFKAHPPRPGAPHVWFGVYERPIHLGLLPARDDRKPCHLGPWQPGLDQETYIEAICRIRELIAAGDTYQVNFTHQYRARFEGDPARIFLELGDGGHGGMAAFVRSDRHAIVSTSPELFFCQEGDKVTTRPMKGTVWRRSKETDAELGERLRASPKERAENLMIVDLLRNDLGRVARKGTVEVPDLFTIESYETVMQMTSTVTALTDADPVQTLGALFPCGSITGVPKIRTMQIIADLERRPRGVYTGAIGWIGPGRRACFNIAIRTLEIDIEEGCARYGVGSGITWDSDPSAEYEETVAKALVLARCGSV